VKPARKDNSSLIASINLINATRKPQGSLNPPLGHHRLSHGTHETVASAATTRSTFGLLLLPKRLYRALADSGWAAMAY
jgi:hypothetical protein